MNFNRSVLLVSLVLHLISILHIKAFSMSPLFPEILQGHVSFFSVLCTVFTVLEHVVGSCLIRTDDVSYAFLGWGTWIYLDMSTEAMTFP